MVSAPNSLSMNAVNFQKAKSAPLVIKKNISTTPVQINKKTIDEGTMRKMLDEADQSGVDKGEIIQGLLDRGYDIEEPKTFMQKAGQIGKNIVGGTLGGLPALGPYLLGGAMKGLGSLGVAPGLPAQTKITQGMKDVGQELISRGEQASNITEKALGANPNDTSTQLARSVVPIASQIIASGPLGLTKAGARAFQTAKAGIAARSLPTIAKGVAQGALVGGTEQAMFDVAQTGETTAKNVALGATVGGALPVVAPLVQSAGKYVKNVLPGKLVSSAEESVSKALAPTKNKMKQLTERISPEFLKKGIRGSKESMQKLAKENAEKFGIKIDDAIESGVLDDVVIPRGEVDKILHEAKLTTMVGNKVVNDTKYKVVAGLQDMISQFPEAIQGREARALRQILDEVVYATKGGIGAEDLTYKNGLVKAMANTLRSEISKVAPDLASLNKEFSFYRTLEQILDETITRQKPQSGMLRKGASILFAGQQEGIGNKIMGYVGSKVFLDATSSATWNTISAQLKYKLANAIARGNPIAVNEVVKIINKKHNAGLPEMKALPAPKATVVAPGGLPQVKQPIAPLTKPIQILETGKANIKQPSTTKPQTLPPSTKAPLVQSTKTAPKLPVAKKTPLKQASESVNVAPKKVQALQALDATNPKQELMNRVIDNEQAVRKVIEETNPTLPKVKIDDFIERAKQGRAGTDEMVKEILKKLDTPKLSPKTPKVLKVPTPLSKVDDALPKKTPVGKPLPKVDDSLLVEARKYKSADEFAKGLRNKDDMKAKILMDGFNEKYKNRSFEDMLPKGIKYTPDQLSFLKGRVEPNMQLSLQDAKSLMNNDRIIMDKINKKMGIDLTRSKEKGEIFEAQLRKIRDQTSQPTTLAPLVKSKGLGEKMGNIKQIANVNDKIDDGLLVEARKTPLTPKERANIISKSSEDVTNDVMNKIDKIPTSKQNFGEIDGKEITREIKSKMDEYYGKYNKSITKRVKQREPIRQKKNMLFDYDGTPVEILSYTKGTDANYIKVRDYFKGGKTTTLTDEGIIKLKPVGVENQEKVMKNGREISIDIFENPFTKQKVRNLYKK